ncbi:MAG: sigma-70 family RNA polymerase sigma factor [Candidatus Anammoximicrobium sp.]|mgnify:CR=1 FL=1|nr:sigma-70 family RNA polymerase sigma factor [Candidatus Anammoximicrobium sp.]
MPPPSRAEKSLIDRIRRGEADAWGDLIERYEGRLLAFVEGRVGRRTAAEDIVQETFLGFLTSLPNYDGKRSLESYLFSICAYKLTDHLRREGRRPAVPFSVRDDSTIPWDPASTARAASSIARSVERRGIEERALVEALQHQVTRIRERREWTKLECLELLFVAGWANKDVAAELRLSEQQVANFKFDFLANLRRLIRNQGLSPDVFPELYEE